MEKLCKCERSFGVTQKGNKIVCKVCKLPITAKTEPKEEFELLKTFEVVQVFHDKGRCADCEAKELCGSSPMGCPTNEMDKQLKRKPLKAKCKICGREGLLRISESGKYANLYGAETKLLLCHGDVGEYTILDTLYEEKLEEIKERIRKSIQWKSYPDNCHPGGQMVNRIYQGQQLISEDLDLIISCGHYKSSLKNRELLMILFETALNELVK